MTSQECQGVSNHWQLDWLLSSLFMLLTKETSKLPVTVPLLGGPLILGGFPSQAISNAESIFMWWLHHDLIRGLIMISFSLKGNTAVKFGRHCGSICHPNFQALVLTRSYDNMSYRLLKYVPELMMTSSNGNMIFRVTGPLCGNSLVIGEFPSERPVMQSFDVFFDLCLTKRLRKQSEAGDLRCHRAHYDIIVMF